MCAYVLLISINIFKTEQNCELSSILNWTCGLFFLFSIEILRKQLIFFLHCVKCRAENFQRKEDKNRCREKSATKNEFFLLKSSTASSNKKNYNDFYLFLRLSFVCFFYCCIIFYFLCILRIFFLLLFYSFICQGLGVDMFA